MSAAVALALRKDHPPVLQSRAVYERLTALAVGDAIPADIYVSDYRDGSIPDWRIHYREDDEGVVLLLVVLDMSNTYIPGAKRVQSDGLAQLSLFAGDTDAGDVRYPAVRILSSQRKTLRCHPIEFSGIEADHWPMTLCDMLQQGKVAVHGNAAQRKQQSQQAQQSQRKVEA